MQFFKVKIESTGILFLQTLSSSKVEQKWKQDFKRCKKQILVVS